MTHLTVTDLQQDKALDTEAMLSIKGGYSYLAPWFVGGTNVISENLFNQNTQLNIAVGSAGVFQNNTNDVFQF